MAGHFDREQLLAAFDEIGEAAVAADAHLDIAVYGGSALMLASNFRFATEDVDIEEIGEAWPPWLTDAVLRIAERRGWAQHWLNDAVSSFLSPRARRDRDLVIYGTFPRAADRTGLTVFVPTARYMLALKLKALRVAAFEKGAKDLADIAALMRVLQIDDADAAVAVLTEYFPNSTTDAEKARFVLRHILSTEGPRDAPRYPRPDL
jgi:hypothetical protein